MSAGPLSVLACLLYYQPHRTGYSIYVQRLAEALVRRGHQVTVLCARHDPASPAQEVAGGVKVVRLWAPVGVSRGLVMPAYPLAFARLARRADAVIVNTPMAETALVALLAGWLGKPLLVTHHGDLVLPAGLGNRLTREVMFRLYGVLARRARYLVGSSEDYAEHSYYLSPWRDKVVAIAPPVELPEPRPGRVRELRARWSQAGGPVIGYSGRFVEEKRPDLLLEALDVVAARHPGVRAVLAGQYDIPYEPTWRRHRDLVERQRDRLVLLGSLSSPQEMADFYAALDVLVLPSDTESFALVQVEAMHCGTPVVATDTPGARMPVIRTGMGKIVPRGDVRAIAEAVLEVVASPAKFRKAPAAVRSAYDLERTVDAYEGLLREVTGRGAGGRPASTS